MPLAPLLRLSLSPVASGNPLAAATLAGVLSRVLLDAPDRDVLEIIAGLDMDYMDNPTLHDAVGALASASRTADETACRREHVRLFLDPRGAVCMPWQSVWTDRPPRLMGASHASALQFYASAGHATLAPQDPADHAGLELGFIALLASRIANGDDQRSLLVGFWAAHVEPWLVQFAEALTAAAHCPLYHHVGQLLRYTVESGEVCVDTVTAAATA